MKGSECVCAQQFGEISGYAMSSVSCQHPNAEQRLHLVEIRRTAGAETGNPPNLAMQASYGPILISD